MFKKKFGEDMQNIRVTDERKAEMLERIEVEQFKKPHLISKKKTKRRWISAVAAAVALVIVSISAFGLPNFKNGEISNNIAADSNETINYNGVDFPVISHPKGIPANVTHNQVYELFSSIYELNEVQYGILTDGTIYLEDMEYEDGYDDGYDDVFAGDTGSKEALTNENTTEKPSDIEETETVLEDAGEEDYSTTNTQVENVDEADIVKTDGKYIYILNSRDFKVCIAKAEQGKLSNIASFDVIEEKDIQDKSYYAKYYSVTEMDMYLCSDRVVIIHEDHTNEKSSTIVKIYDVSNPQKPSFVCEVSQSGSYLSSRVIDNRLYIFTNETIYNKPEKGDKTTYLPCTSVNGDAPTPVNEGSIYMFDGVVNRSYLTVSSVNVKDGKVVDTKTALGGGQTLYANTKGFYVTADAPSVSYLTDDFAYYDDKTRVIRFEIDDGKINAMAEGAVEGTPLNQFSMDEYDGHFRIVTTGYDGASTVNAVYVLDKELKTVGKITDIAKGERVYSVRFMGNIGYFVTFRQVDPLFAVDLSNPKAPKILSALKIPGFSNYMHPWGEGLLLGIGADANETTGISGDVKLSMFDISDPENVSEKSKEIIEYLRNSDIGTNHKEILVDYNKNLIGFAAGGDFYYLYSYSNDKGFELKDILDVPQYLDSQGNYDYYYWTSNNVRGIYIGEYFYVCSGVGINSYKLSDFSEVDSLWFFA